MKVHLQRVGPVLFDAIAEDGTTVRLDGPEKLGGAGGGMRPMELFLVSLAGCAAMDVVMILEQQKQRIDAMSIEVEGARADAIPAVYETVTMRFELRGEIADNKLQRAVKLSVEKYCSVASMLLPSVDVRFVATLA